MITRSVVLSSVCEQDNASRRRRRNMVSMGKEYLQGVSPMGGISPGVFLVREYLQRASPVGEYLQGVSPVRGIYLGVSPVKGISPWGISDGGNISRCVFGEGIFPGGVSSGGVPLEVISFRVDPNLDVDLRSIVHFPQHWQIRILRYIVTH